MQATLAGILPGEAEIKGKGKAPYWPFDKRKKSIAEEPVLEHKSVWEPPPPGWVKFNIDGSFVQQSSEAGVGVIARDRGGQITLSAWHVLSSGARMQLKRRPELV